MIRKLLLAGLAILAARLAGRALARQAELTGLLWMLVQAIAVTGTGSASNTAKVRSLEARLALLVPRIPVPVPAPATTAGGSGNGSDSSSSAGNSSFDMAGGTQISYDPAGSGNNGGQNSQTSGQIGSASPHTHSMTHFHSSSGDLQNVVNATRDSHSALVTTVNGLRSSHGNLVSTVNSLVSDHAQLITDHKNLVQACINAGVLN